MDLSRFTYKGKSSLDFGLIITKAPAPAGPVRDVEYLELGGRSGTLLLDNGRFEDVEVSYPFIIAPGFERVPATASAIKAWLLTDVSPGALADTFDPDYFRIAVCSGPLDITEIVRQVGEGKIVFTCNPYKYSHTGQETISITTPTSLMNPEPFDSLPYFKLTGSGAATLYVAGQSIRISNIDGYLELDSEIAQAFKGAVNKNSTVTLDEFPVMPAGEIPITWEGNITKVEIIPRWRTL